VNFKRALIWQHRKLLNIARLQGSFSYQPATLSFTLTGACNLRCSMCSTRSKEALFLDPDHITRTIDEVSGKWWWKRPVIHLIGGEPLLHPAFNDLVEYIRGKGFPVAITTNGYQLERHIDHLLSVKVNHITISIDGPEELHDGIRGVKGSYAHARKSVSMINESRGYKPTIAVNCTISPANQDRLVETIGTLDTWGIRSITVQHLVFDRNDTSLADEISTDIVNRELTQIKNSPPRTTYNVFPPIKPRDIEAYYRDLEYPFGRHCVVPWLVARIYPGSEVAPCLDLYMGSLGSDSLFDIWNNSRWRRLRSTRKTGKLLSGCVRCCHRQYYG